MPSSRDNASIHGSQRKPPGSPPHSKAPGVITAQVQSQLHGREMTVAGAYRPHLPRRAGDGTRAANPGPAHPCAAIKWLCDLRTWTGTGRKQLKRAPWENCSPLGRGTKAFIRIPREVPARLGRVGVAIPIPASPSPDASPVQRLPFPSTLPLARGKDAPWCWWR